MQQQGKSALDILAEAAATKTIEPQPGPSETPAGTKLCKPQPTSAAISPVLSESLAYPKRTQNPLPLPSEAASKKKGPWPVLEEVKHWWQKRQRKDKTRLKQR